jgi:hypothetical protein
MTPLVSIRGCQGDYSARRPSPLSGRQGVYPSEVTRAGKVRPVDTIAGARKAAEKTA